MEKTEKDKRLPENLHVFLNRWGEYVVCKNNCVFQFEGENVRCGKSKDEAIFNYLTKKVR